jgi:hypothetical protein
VKIFFYLRKKWSNTRQILFSCRPATLPGRPSRLFLKPLDSVGRNATRPPGGAFIWCFSEAGFWSYRLPLLRTQLAASIFASISLSRSHKTRQNTGRTLCGVPDPLSDPASDCLIFETPSARPRVFPYCPAVFRHGARSLTQNADLLRFSRFFSRFRPLTLFFLCLKIL